MNHLDALGVAVVILAAVTIVMAITVIAATVLVAGAVHAEEQRMTLTGLAPGRLTRLARTLLAVPVGQVIGPVPDAGPEQVPAWFERGVEAAGR
jgi:hypothetical protein